MVGKSMKNYMSFLNKNFDNSQLFSAFTLAEVLIVLGLIGVIASITIPALITNYQKNQTVEKLRKAYTILSQSVKLSELDNGPNRSWDWGIGANNIRSSFNLYWGNYLKIAKYCSSYADCGYASNTIYSITGIDSGSYYYEAASRTPVILADGILLDVVSRTAGGTNPANLIFVDINGGALPNKYGKDVFRFVLDPIKGFMPDGYTETPTAINTDPGSGCEVSGKYCAAKVMLDGWKIADDYPW